MRPMRKYSPTVVYATFGILSMSTIHLENGIWHVLPGKTTCVNVGQPETAYLNQPIGFGLYLRLEGHLQSLSFPSVS
jgi:hypothetical protein